MPRSNNVIPNNHKRKDWQRFIKTHLDQPARRKHRAALRKAKIATKAPRPLNKFRPIVNCPTQKYNMRLRAGKGFSLLELKKVNLHPRYARTIGISVDTRRRNRSQEGMSRNVRRLKQYLERLVLFPVAPKTKDLRSKEKMVAHYEAIEKAKGRLKQYKRYVNTAMPMHVDYKKPEIVSLKDVPEYNALATLRNEWAIQHHHFRWRRKNIRLAKKRIADAKRAAKKAAKKGR